MGFVLIAGIWVNVATILYMVPEQEVLSFFPPKEREVCRVVVATAARSSYQTSFVAPKPCTDLLKEFKR